MRRVQAFCGRTSGPLAVEGERACGEVRRDHVRAGARRGRAGAGAGELSGPYPDLQSPRSLVPRPFVALQRIRRLPPQRGIGRAARADRHPRRRPGRRACLLPRGPHRERGLRRIYADFGFADLRVGSSTRRALRAGADAVWDRAEAALAGAARGPPGSTSSGRRARAHSAGRNSNTACATAPVASGNAAPSNSTSCCSSRSRPVSSTSTMRARGR